jgi:hypothetical protein
LVEILLSGNRSLPDYSNNIVMPAAVSAFYRLREQPSTVVAIQQQHTSLSTRLKNKLPSFI